MLKLNVCGQSIAGEYSPVASDSINYLRAFFSFSPDWNGLVKTAQFSQNGTVYNSLIENNYCAVPNELCDGKVLISVFGQEPGKTKRITTLPFEMTIRKSGFSSDSETPVPPTPDLYSQLLEKVETSIKSLPLAAGEGENSTTGGYVLPEKVTGNASFAYGSADNEVSASCGYAFGIHNNVSGNNSFAAGSWNTVSEKYGTAFGEGNAVTVTRGAAFGNGNRTSNTESQFVCGKYNARTPGLFIVGNGTSYTDLSNALVVKENGDATLSGKLTVSTPTAGGHAATKGYVDGKIPEKLSELENDAGYISEYNFPTSIMAESVVSATTLDLYAKDGVTLGTISDEYSPFTKILGNTVDIQAGGGDLNINGGAVELSGTTLDIFAGGMTIGASSLTIAGNSITIGETSYGFSVSQNRIKNVGTPTEDNDAATKGYVDSRYISMTQSEYNALSVKDPNKFYFVEAD